MSAMGPSSRRDYGAESIFSTERNDVGNESREPNTRVFYIDHMEPKHEESVTTNVDQQDDFFPFRQNLIVGDTPNPNLKVNFFASKMLSIKSLLNL
jgi:hypothetical protein